MGQGVTFQEVSQAAELLRAQGYNPTIDRVREFLGGTGSNTTISKYLNQWKQQVSALGSEARELPPDIVKTAVTRAWEDLRQEADARMEAVKKEAQSVVDAAEKRAQVAVDELQALREAHAQLEESFKAQAAEKELLVLDVKQAREAHALLQERYQASQQRYTEMQAFANQQIVKLDSTHQTEINRLQDTINEFKKNNQALIDQLRDKNEAERHQFISLIDSLKVEKQKLLKQQEALQTRLEEQLTQTTKLTSRLDALANERDEVARQLAEHQQKWDTFHAKSLVADEMLSVLTQAPKMDVLFSAFRDQLFTTMESKWETWHSMLMSEREEGRVDD